MMTPGKYLLYDGRCERCTLLADELENAFAGIIHLADLRDRESRRLLDTMRPAWRFEPTLVLLDDHNGGQAYTGLSLRIRLIRMLGLKRSLRSLLIARKYRVPAIGVGPLGVRPHPVAGADEIEALDAHSPVRLQPDVPLGFTQQDGQLTLRFLDRELTLPGHAAADVKWIAGRGLSPFTVDEPHGLLDLPGRLVLLRLLLSERALVTIQTSRPAPARTTTG